jgi:hypothetical protein
MNVIEIRDSQNGVLIAGLSGILSQFPPHSDNLHWAFLSLEALGNLGDNKSLPEFESQIADSPEGLLVTWDELCELSEKFEQVIDAVIVGCESRGDIRRYQNDNELYSSYDVVIEAFDSSYWRVYSKYKDIIDRIEKSFKNTEIVG